MLAKAVHDVGWGLFLMILLVKAVEAARVGVKVYAPGTSQECLCGAPMPKRLGERWHRCAACGLSVPRDTTMHENRIFKATIYLDAKATPLRRTWIPKRRSAPEKRPLEIPTQHDRAQQTLVRQALKPEPEACVMAYTDDCVVLHGDGAVLEHNQHLFRVLVVD